MCTPRALGPSSPPSSFPLISLLGAKTLIGYADAWAHGSRPPPLIDRELSRHVVTMCTGFYAHNVYWVHNTELVLGSQYGTQPARPQCVPHSVSATCRLSLRFPLVVVDLTQSMWLGECGCILSLARKHPQPENSENRPAGSRLHDGQETADFSGPRPRVQRALTRERDPLTPCDVGRERPRGRALR